MDFLVKPRDLGHTKFSWAEVLGLLRAQSDFFEVYFEEDVVSYIS